MAKKPTNADTLKLRTFKLSDSTMADLNLVAADMIKDSGTLYNLTEVIRILARRAAERIRKKIRNSR
jgi:hypothetical protein